MLEALIVSFGILTLVGAIAVHVSARRQYDRAEEILHNAGKLHADATRQLNEADRIMEEVRHMSEVNDQILM